MPTRIDATNTTTRETRRYYFDDRSGRSSVFTEAVTGDHSTLTCRHMSIDEARQELALLEHPWIKF